MPLFSSFNPGGVFIPPPSSLDENIKNALSRGQDGSKQGTVVNTRRDNNKSGNNTEQLELGGANEFSLQQQAAALLRLEGPTMFNRVQSAYATSKPVAGGGGGGNYLTQPRPSLPKNENPMDTGNAPTISTTNNATSAKNLKSDGTGNFRMTTTLGVRSGGFGLRSKQGSNAGIIGINGGENKASK